MIERFRGCLLGLAVGDAVGLPFEGIDGYGIFQSFGRAIDIVRSPPVENLSYSDDTQMMIGVAETLIEFGDADPANLATAFGRNYDPGRGYGGGAKKILQAIKDGKDASSMPDTVFPGGSFGNGAAMRVAPIGICFHRDLDRVAYEAARSAQVTHRHPVGVEGAVVLATAVAMAIQPHVYDRATFYAELYGRVATDEFRERIETASTSGNDISPSSLGHGVEAHTSVVTAVLCYDQFRDSYEQTLASAIRAGGDVDTIAAMACAISGASLGITAIPQHLLDRLENDEQGRDYIDLLAVKLFERFEKTH